jgi:putative endopeptidase
MTTFRKTEEPTMTSVRARFCLSLAALALLTIAGSGLAQARHASQETSGSGSEDHGVQLSSIDKTCKPCQDFYHFANGEWLKNNPIPAAYPSWNSFSSLQERNQTHLKEILEKAEASSAAPGSNEQKIGDFYSSCMNEPQINADGVKPLAPEVQKIEAVDGIPALENEIAHLQSIGVNALFRFRSTQDAKDSTQVIGGADQGGLGMPDRDYYLETGKKEVDEKNAKIRAQYVDHVSKMFQLLGDDDAKASSETQVVMDIETKLARASLTRVERRDPEKLYHKMDRSELKTLTPDFSWDGFFQDIGYPNIDTVDVAVPKFFQEMNDDLKSIPLSSWKTYLRWHLVDAYAAELSQPFVDEDFNFRGRALQGTKELLPRWKRCVQATDRQLGEALGQSYVKEYFPPEAKARAQEMVANLVAALQEDLHTLPWMGEATREQALKKLNAFTRKIGYPDKWRDYSAFNVDRGPYALNSMRGREFEFNRSMKKIGQPVDKAEWGMSPPTVNAYYSPERNEIVFPAGILQPPFFDPKADDASNYGGMGAVIGHEMTHGFDDEGRKFDADGNLRDWWTPEDAKNFEVRAECVQKQFDSYVVEGDLHENGKLVLGESIADLGGLTIAYNALEKDLEGKPRTLIGGYTPEQRFFLAYAQIWAANDRPEFERLMVNTNPHALDRFRAIAAPTNMPAFYKAFDCQEGDAMVRPSAIRCQIW